MRTSHGQRPISRQGCDARQPIGLFEPLGRLSPAKRSVKAVRTTCFPPYVSSSPPAAGGATKKAVQSCDPERSRHRRRSKSCDRQTVRRSGRLRTRATLCGLNALRRQGHRCCFAGGPAQRYELECRADGTTNSNRLGDNYLDTYRHRPAKAGERLRVSWMCSKLVGGLRCEGGRRSHDAPKHSAAGSKPPVPVPARMLSRIALSAR